MTKKDMAAMFDVLQVRQDMPEKVAKKHGLSLFAFFRLSADEHIKNYAW